MITCNTLAVILLLMIVSGDCENLGRNDAEDELLKGRLRTAVRKLFDEFRNKSTDTGEENLPFQMKKRPIPSNYNPLTDEIGDCLNQERGILRNYPLNNNCYNRQHVNIEELKKTWWSLYSEIEGDFKYAFDFVLWDKNPTKNENKFWYLMIYLKTLTKHRRSCDEILSMNTYRKSQSELEKQINKLTNVGEDVHREMDMFEKLTNVNRGLAIYQNDIRMLEEKLIKVMNTVGGVQIQKNVLSRKLNDLDIKTVFIESIIDNFRPKMRSFRRV